MAPPKLTAEQRTAALAKAAEARRARAEMKELLRTGSLTLSEVFARSQGDNIVANTRSLQSSYRFPVSARSRPSG